MDFNGDGLPDRVKKSGNSLYISCNLGNGNWSSYETISGMDNISYGTSFSESANGSLTAGFTLFAILKITVGVSTAPYNRTFSKDKVQLIDFNNDGYVDYVTSNAENNISVRYHQGAKTNLLKQVTNFTGSKIVLDYQMPPSCYEQPQRSWLLTGVRAMDEYSPAGQTATHTSIEYYHPHYNRHERMEYGYDSLVIKQYDTQNSDALYRYTVEQYNNKNFLKRGKKTRDILYDADHKPYIEHIYEIRLVDMTNGQPVGDSVCPDAAFPNYESEITNYYEGNSVPQMTTKISREYDNRRNVITYINAGDMALTDEYLKATITYKTGLPNNMIALPEQITVTDVNGTVMRKRQASYNSNGKLTQIKAWYNNSNYAQTDMEYNDSWGNVTKIILPTNLNNDRMYYQYQYDNVHHCLPVSVTSAPGYTSSTQYSYKWGKPTKTIDINRGEMRYSYDKWGRLSSVTAPNEIPSGYTIQMMYPETSSYFMTLLTSSDTPNSALGASTSHYDPQHPNNPITTVTVCDGWGRVIQVRKDVEVAGMERTQVSGRTVLDAFGRTVQQYYPVLVTDVYAWSGGYSLEYETQIPPTQTSYDILDRPLSITDPLGNVTTHAYGFGYDYTGYLRPVHTTTDANGNSVKLFTKSRGQKTQIDAPLNTVTKFDYNAMGELLSSTYPENLETGYQYDLLGRCIQRIHPDAGTDEYRFDPAGNMTERKTQNLINNGESIEYSYHFNQLTDIVYPEHRENNVSYKYGDPSDSNSVAARATGRIYWQEDASGYQKFAYDHLGNVTENIRTFVPPNEYNTYTFKMNYRYDSWGRITDMVYPDQEWVSYEYNHAGDLYRMNSSKGNESFHYIDSIYYDKYGHKTAVWYGNGTRVNYQYDDLQRLQYLNSYTSAS